ncbi:MAG: AAA family ATPase [Thermodesulfovibrionales bacterium]
MAKKIWEHLDNLYALHSGAHSKKLASMFIREEKTVPVKFIGETTEQPAICFKVVNKDASNGGPSLHNVLIAKDRKTGLLTIWCGDTSVVKSDKETESKCEYWKKRKTSGSDEYMCKHCCLVFQDLNSTKRAQIHKILDEGVPQVANGTRLAMALELWKSAFAFGPTGSGKTHAVRELLNASGYEIHAINITDGLEDVDLLQKLLPDKEKGWTRLVGELRAAFDAATKKKVVVILEEVMRSSRSLRNLLVKALDNEAGFYTLHDITTGERIRVPVGNLLFFATANLGYSDTSELDPALARRFPVFVFMDYDVAKEKELLERKVGADTAKRLAKLTKGIREQYRQGRLPVPLDTGSLLEWADVISRGVDLAEAAAMTWLFRVLERDPMGYPEAGQLEAISDLLQAA